MTNAWDVEMQSWWNVLKWRSIVKYNCNTDFRIVLNYFHLVSGNKKFQLFIRKLYITLCTYYHTMKSLLKQEIKHNKNTMFMSS